MGIEEAILTEVKEKGKIEGKILGIQKALKRGKLGLEEIPLLVQAYKKRVVPQMLC
jgi:hypothetical protein